MVVLSGNKVGYALSFFDVDFAIGIFNEYYFTFGFFDADGFFDFFWQIHGSVGKVYYFWIFFRFKKADSKSISK